MDVYSRFCARMSIANLDFLELKALGNEPQIY